MWSRLNARARSKSVTFSKEDGPAAGLVQRSLSARTSLNGSERADQNQFRQSASNAADVIATTIPPSNTRESAILIRFEPGAYTAIVTGAGDTTGIGLIKVYEIEHDQDRRPPFAGARFRKGIATSPVPWPLKR